MSKSIFQATLYDQDVPDAGAETKYNEESGDSSCYSEGEDPPLESSRAEDCKRGSIYGNWMYRHSWSTNKVYVHNTTLPCPLAERCGCPCKAKLEE